MTGNQIVFPTNRPLDKPIINEENKYKSIIPSISKIKRMSISKDVLLCEQYSHDNNSDPFSELAFFYFPSGRVLFTTYFLGTLQTLLFINLFAKKIMMPIDKEQKWRLINLILYFNLISKEGCF